MPVSDPAFWTEHLRQNLHGYEESLLRQVAAQLIKPRSQWPADELIRRMAETAENAAVIDRRLREQSAAGRHLLAAIGYSRQPRWYAGHLIELLAALGHGDGLAEILALLQCGLLYPDLTGPSGGNDADKNGRVARTASRCKSFEDWLGRSTPGQMILCAHPWVTRRADGEPLPLPDLSVSVDDADSSSEARNLTGSAARLVREADGLEWPLRLAILWQQVREAPLRRTLQGDFFKRDLDRLRSDPLLSGPPADCLEELPDPGLLTASLARNNEVLAENEGQLVTAELPAAWRQGLPETLAALWVSLVQVDDWNGERGWVPAQTGNPFPSAYLLCLLLLRQLPRGRWSRSEDVSRWVLEHHPFWNLKASAGKAKSQPSAALTRFLLGLAFPLKLIQARHDDQDHWLIRLSEVGRWLLGQGEKPALPSFPQTLLVQPNLEILVYRQGLTPELLARLTRFARWKNLGPACGMQLEAATVYAALESGETFESILQLLQRHGIKPPAAPVIDSLRTWSQKRERISVYPSALILEFLNHQDLEDALARGIPATPVGENLAIIVREADIDYRHFRLISNRDYTVPPEKCVSVAEDGVTLRVDLNRSDLLLESDVRRFADELETEGNERVFHITPGSVQRGRDMGLGLDSLEAWFSNRCDHPLTPAARLLLLGKDSPPAVTRRLTLVQVASEELADGLMQWPETRALVQERIGPTALVVAEDRLPEFGQKLRLLGMETDI
jgi:hypothetical protein